MNGEVLNLFIEDLGTLLDDFDAGEFNKCPVGTEMPRGLQILLRIERERLILERKRNGSPLWRIIYLIIRGGK